MTKPAGEDEVQINAPAVNNLRALKHDIKNQLSNIHLSLEQLRFELSEANEDCVFYIDLIAKSSVKINSILDTTE